MSKDLPRMRQQQPVLRDHYFEYPDPVYSCDELSSVGEQQDVKVASKFLLLRSWRRVYYKHFEESVHLFVINLYFLLTDFRVIINLFSPSKVIPDRVSPKAFLPNRRIRITGSSGLELIADISERYGVYGNMDY